jgi:hypothetical protein
MATGVSTSTQTTQIDPAVQPYLSYGLQEAQRLYQAGGPQYYPGQTFVAPSTQTQTGLQALEQRATQGSPLLRAAQTQLGQTIGGQFLGGNPFFQGAFQPAAQAAQTAFQQGTANLASQASRAGRYGSGAMTNLQSQLANQFGQNLANTAGQLAYQNYAAERAAQERATGMAPSMAMADYGDIQSLLGAGQARENYLQQALQSDINRFNFMQNAPQQNLQNYLNMVYGFPAGRTTTTQTPFYTNPTATALGTGLLGVSLLGGLDRLGTGGTGGLQQGWNWLTGLFNT